MNFFSGRKGNHLWLIIGVVVSLGIGSSLYYQPWLVPNRICPGVRVEDVDLGGLNPQAAEQRLKQRFDRQLSKPITIVSGKLRYQVCPQEIGYDWAYIEAVKAAYNVGRVGSLGDKLWDQFNTYWSGKEINLGYQVDTKAYKSWVNQLVTQVDKPPKSVEITVNAQGEMIIKSEEFGQGINLSALQQGLEKVINQQEGRLLLIPVEKLKPEITRSDLAKLHIEKRIGSYSTNYDASNINRSKNIQVAAKALKMVLVKPGAVFSYNDVIEKNTSQSDWSNAPVIIEGELVEGLGGGICQVSTTLYNAALLANLQIVERNHHSLPVGYVPIGLDATVAGNYLDLKLGHKQQQAFLITALTKQGTVTVNIFGADVGEMDIAIKQSPVQEIPPDTKIIKDAKLRRGMNFTKEGKKGYRITTWRIINNNGEFKEELVSKDLYRPIPTEIYQGIGH